MAASVDALRELLIEAGVAPELARRLDAARPMLRQGVDSVDFPAFCALLEERLGCALDDDTAARLSSLDDFARFLAGGQ
jgi:acyl carrier protein